MERLISFLERFDCSGNLQFDEACVVRVVRRHAKSLTALTLSACSAVGDNFIRANSSLVALTRALDSTPRSSLTLILTLSPL